MLLQVFIRRQVRTHQGVCACVFTNGLDAIRLLRSEPCAPAPPHARDVRRHLAHQPRQARNPWGICRHRARLTGPTRFGAGPGMRERRDDDPLRTEFLVGLGRARHHAHPRADVRFATWEGLRLAHCGAHLRAPKMAQSHRNVAVGAVPVRARAQRSRQGELAGAVRLVRVQVKLALAGLCEQLAALACAHGMCMFIVVRCVWHDRRRPRPFRPTSCAAPLLVCAFQVGGRNGQRCRPLDVLVVSGGTWAARPAR